MSICVDKPCCRHVVEHWEDTAGSHTNYVCCNCGYTSKVTVGPFGTGTAWERNPIEHGPFLP